MSQNIEIKSNLFGRLSVSYLCPKCGARLSSPLNSAGTTDTCPDCHSQFMVPGSKELENRRNLKRVKAQQQEDQTRRKLEAKHSLDKFKQVEMVAEQQRELAKEREKEALQLPLNVFCPCPFCAEEILSAAKKCKHCGEFVDTVLRQQQFRLTNRPSRGVAALLSFLIPGLGQIYKGSVLSGLLWFVFVLLGYAMFILPGLILHLICILDAAS